MRQFLKYGSVRGAAGNSRLYRDNRLLNIFDKRFLTPFVPSSTGLLLS